MNRHSNRVEESPGDSRPLEAAIFIEDERIGRDSACTARSIDPPGGPGRSEGSSPDCNPSRTVNRTMPSIYCPHCKSTFSIPDELPLELLREMVRVRDVGIIPSRETNMLAKGSSTAHPADRKSIAIHLVRTDEKCHSCQSSLEGEGIVECPSCHSINFGF
jgi:Zn finger protein HypA/HybF involved in hydrogenase expression